MSEEVQQVSTTPVKKRPGILSFFKRHGFFFLFIAIILWIISKQLVAFYEPIFYEEYISYEKQPDSTHAKAYISQHLYFKFSTDKAFIPYEKIKVTAKIGAVEPDVKRYMKKNSVSVYFIEAEDVGRFSGKTPSEKPLTDEEEMEEQFSVKDASIVLMRTDVPDIYEGKGEIMYRKPGKHNIELKYSGFPDVKTNLSLEIGSSTDVMNKKTNDLLFIIAVVSLAVAVFAEFRRR